MNRRHTILTTLAPMLVTAVAAAEPAVRLRSQASVTGAEVRLGDIASLTGLDQRAAETVVLTLNEGQRSGRVELHDIARALRRAGINPVPIEFLGAASCTVHRGASSAPALPALAAGAAHRENDGAGNPTRSNAAGRAEAAARDAAAGSPPGENPATVGQRIRELVAEQLQVGAEEVDIAFPRLSAVPADTPVTDEMSILSTDTQPLGRRRWRIEYVDEQGIARRRYVSGVVSVRRKVVKAVRDLQRGQTVIAADVEVGGHDDDGAHPLMTDLSAVIGQRVARPIRAGSPVSDRHLDAPLLVRRGQDVTVRSGPVRVVMRALGAGRLGERVELENQQSGSRLWAVVTGPGQATVDVAATTPQEAAQ